MTNSEFSEWLAFFDAAFPSYADKRKSRNDRESVEAVWANLMADVSLRHAKMATLAAQRDELADLTSMTPWDKFPPKIRQKARQLSFQATQSSAGPSRRSRGPDGEWTYACLKCSDTGWREVVSAKSLHDSKSFEIWMETGYVWPALAACSCEVGQKFSAWKQPVNRYADMRQAIDYPGIIERPRTPVEWRNWLLNQVRKSHEWNPDSQPTEYTF